MKNLIACLFFLALIYYLKFSLTFNFSTLLFFAGGVLGFFLFYLNYFLYPNLAAKTDVLAQKTNEILLTQNISYGVKFLQLNEEKMTFQPLKNILNFVAVLVMTFFINTSSGSPLAIGLVLGLVFHFNLKALTDFKKPQLLAQWYTPIKKQLDYKTQQIIIWVGVAASLLLYFWM